MFGCLGRRQGHGEKQVIPIYQYDPKNLYGKMRICWTRSQDPWVPVFALQLVHTVALEEMFWSSNHREN